MGNTLQPPDGTCNHSRDISELFDLEVSHDVKGAGDGIDALNGGHLFEGTYDGRHAARKRLDQDERPNWL